MRYVTVLALLLICISSSAQARSVPENPFHLPETKRVPLNLSPEHESQLFLRVQEELGGCLADYLLKSTADSPKTMEALDELVVKAFAACVRESVAIIRAHDRIFGKGTGAPYYHAYIQSTRERMQVYFKILQVESK